MATFVYNPHSVEDRDSQWKSYLQQREFSNDISTAITQQTQALQESLQLDSINENLTTGLQNIAGHLSGLTAMLDWRLTLQIEQQRVGNLFLENISRLLRIPEFQKERQHYVEQGFKLFRNAAQDPDLYQIALEHFLQAEEREKTDYIVLKQIGVIYLYNPLSPDPTKAELYFRKAAKFALVESDPNSIRATNILSADVRSDIGTIAPDRESIQLLAAECLDQAARACYIQGKYKEAKELAQQAYQRDARLTKALHTLGKALISLGEIDRAAQALRELVLQEAVYYPQIQDDPEFMSLPAVQQMLKDLYDEAKRVAVLQLKATEDLLHEFKNRLLKAQRLDREAGGQLWSEALANCQELSARYRNAQACLSRGTYLSLLDAQATAQAIAVEIRQRRTQVIDHFEKTIQDRRKKVDENRNVRIHETRRESSKRSSEITEQKKQRLKKLQGSLLSGGEIAWITVLTYFMAIIIGWLVYTLLTQPRFYNAIVAGQLLLTIGIPLLLIWSNLSTNREISRTEEQSRQSREKIQSDQDCEIQALNTKADLELTSIEELHVAVRTLF